MSDSVFLDEEGGGWYFWDETWAYTHGPYETEALAGAAFARYCEEELG